MKKLSSLFLFTFIALVFVAFYTTNTYNRDGSDNPNYQIIKKNFWDAYQNYKINIQSGISTNVPVDPTGTFFINGRGYPDITPRLNPIAPPKYLPDLVSAYTFTQSTTTYAAINTTGTQITYNCDDTYFTETLPFTFVFNGASFTSLAVSCNGWLQIGGTSIYGYSPTCDGYFGNIISPFGNDLYGLATGNGMYYQTTGTAPNRVYTIEWYHWGFYSSGGNEMNVQVKLHETTNAIDFIYQPQTPSYTASYGGMNVGICGTTNADFNVRTTTTNWSATTAGATNCQMCTYTSAIYPANGLTFTFAPPSPPATPTHIRPLNHSTGRPLYDTLQWSASSGATNYNLQIALDSLMTQLVLNDTTMTAVQYTVGQFTPLTNWWWRVRAKNAVGWSPFNVPWVFRTMGAATTPTLLLPANNAVNQPLSLTCAWSRATDQTFKPHGLQVVGETQPDGILHEVQPLLVSNYWYELYSDTTAAPVVRDSTLTDTTKAVSGLLNNRTYWWRVKAKNNVGWGAFTGYFHFTTVPTVPTVPILMRPANNSVVTIFPVWLVWRDTSVVTSYRVQVSPDTLYTTPVFDTTLTTTLPLDSIGVPLSRLTGWMQFYWHVNAANISGTSAYSSSFRFLLPQVGVSQISSEIPKQYKLYGNYPNPFNPECTIKFDLPAGLDVKMAIYNVVGQEIAVPVNTHLAPGSYSLKWNGANFPSGIYFYKIIAGNFTDVKKMVLVK